MSKEVFSPLEISAIGEISNISLGSSATAISNMLDHRIEITTPEVHLVNAEDFELGGIDPAIGVEIKYVTGLEGSNIMLLKMSDVKVIVDILMGTETPDEDFVLDELTLSAVCEVMNQMMGAASTALSDFLGRVVNISTPEAFELEDLEEIKQKRLPVPQGPIVVVKFKLEIEPDVRSEFLNIMSVELAKALIANFNLDTEEEPEPAPAEPEPAAAGQTLSQEEIERMMAGGGAAAAAPEPATEASGGKLSQEEIEKLMAQSAAPQAAAAPPQPSPVPPQAQAPQTAAPQMAPPMQGQQMSAPPMGAVPPQAPPMGAVPPQMQGMPMAGMPPMMGMPQTGGKPGQAPPYPYYGMPPYWPGFPPPQPPAAAKKPDPKVIGTQPPAMPRLANGEELGEEQAQNLELIMGVPLEVTVEIGRTRRKVQDILSFSKGSLVILDKLAGDQVDLFVNGRCIARGEVVVIDDNFGIRIGEILHRPELEDMVSFQ